jgi:hypothetical protein
MVENTGRTTKPSCRLCPNQFAEQDLYEDDLVYYDGFEMVERRIPKDFGGRGGGAVKNV